MKTCARCGTEFASRKKKAVLCTLCWEDEGYTGRSVSEAGRGGSRAVEMHGMIEDDYSAESGKK